MTTAITHTKPLCTIHCSNDEVIFVEMTAEQLDKKMENAYMKLPDGTRLSTARNLIRRYGPSTAVEYYEYHIIPTLPEHIKSQMQDILQRLPGEVKKKISLDVLIRKQKSLS